MYKCEACNKTYSSEYTLKKHKKRQPLCEKWLTLKPCIKDYIDDKFTLPMSDTDIKMLNTKCFICNTVFANIGNLNRHLDTSIICSKWSMYKDLEPLATYIESNTKYNLQQAPTDTSDDCTESETFESFTPPKYSMCHIIWNIFLVDKELVSKPQFGNIVQENNVKYIISILPDEKIYYDKIKLPIEHCIMKYEGHDMQCNIELFDEQCAQIEKYRNERSNIFVFCNNGYQRSIPFLCYYLYKFHNSEVSNIETAVDMILSQVDKANFHTIRDAYVKSVKALFKAAHIL